MSMSTASNWLANFAIGFGEPSLLASFRDVLSLTLCLVQLRPTWSMSPLDPLDSKPESSSFGEFSSVSRGVGIRN